MLKGAATVAVPVRVPPPVFCTVKFCVEDEPTVTEPKAAVVGVTEIAGGVGVVPVPVTVSEAPAPPVKLTAWL
jgi:hypothetical protein